MVLERGRTPQRMYTPLDGTGLGNDGSSRRQREPLNLRSPEGLKVATGILGRLRFNTSIAITSKSGFDELYESLNQDRSVLHDIVTAAQNGDISNYNAKSVFDIMRSLGDVTRAAYESDRDGSQFRDFATTFIDEHLSYLASQANDRADYGIIASIEMLASRGSIPQQMRAVEVLYTYNSTYKTEDREDAIKLTTDALPYYQLDQTALAFLQSGSDVLYSVGSLAAQRIASRSINYLHGEERESFYSQLLSVYGFNYDDMKKLWMSTVKHKIDDKDEYKYTMWVMNRNVATMAHVESERKGGTRELTDSAAHIRFFGRYSYFDLVDQIDFMRGENRDIECEPIIHHDNDWSSTHYADATRATISFVRFDLSKQGVFGLIIEAGSQEEEVAALRYIADYYQKPSMIFVETHGSNNSLVYNGDDDGYSRGKTDELRQNDFDEYKADPNSLLNVVPQVLKPGGTFYTSGCSAAEKDGILQNLSSEWEGIYVMGSAMASTTKHLEFGRRENGTLGILKGKNNQGKDVLTYLNGTLLDGENAGEVS